MLTSFELQNIVEAAFLPTPSTCSIDSEGLMTIQVGEVGTQYRLTIVGIDTKLLQTSRDVVKVVNQLLNEMSARQRPKPRKRQRK